MVFRVRVFVIANAKGTVFRYITEKGRSGALWVPQMVDRAVWRRVSKARLMRSCCSCLFSTLLLAFDLLTTTFEGERPQSLETFPRFEDRVYEGAIARVLML